MSKTANWKMEQLAGLADWSASGTIVDVGGGRGSLLAALLAATPGARGILYDLPGPIEQAERVMAEQGVADRCELVAGNFLERVPAGGDAYVLSRILHDWDDEEAKQILGNIRRAMKPSGSLFIIERVMDAAHPDAPHPDAVHLSAEAVMTDLNMMVMNGGRERTEKEFGVLLDATGFRLERMIETPYPASILVAVASETLTPYPSPRRRGETDLK
jgi:ubiquinone/menaquinone biosynthesis C-methylase UbiE